MANDQPDRREFLESLLQETPSIESTNYKEYRMQLDLNLTAVSRREKFGRRVAQVLWGATVGLVLLGVVLHIQPVFGNVGPPFGLLLIVLAVPVGLFAMLRSLMYVAFDRRAVDSIRQERRDMLLLELQQQVQNLATRIEQLSHGIGGGTAAQ